MQASAVCEARGIDSSGCADERTVAVFSEYRMQNERERELQYLLTVSDDGSTLLDVGFLQWRGVLSMGIGR